MGIDIVIFDTDIFIWIQRKNRNAAELVDEESERFISVLTYMELLQGAKNKQQQQYSLDFLKKLGFATLPLTENIGHRAAIYIEQYALSHGLRTADALIAATAVENGLALCSSNEKHFGPIAGLRFNVFKP